MKSIVIFGGAGFVGKHLIRRLTKNGHKIIVPYQRSVQEAKIRLLGVTGQVIPFRYSSLEDKRLKSVLSNADVCINLKTTYDQKNGDFNNTIYKFNKKLIRNLKSSKELRQFILFSLNNIKSSLSLILCKYKTSVAAYICCSLLNSPPQSEDCSVFEIDFPNNSIQRSLYPCLSVYVLTNFDAILVQYIFLILILKLCLNTATSNLA